jgi:hypothetical protein
MCLLVGVVFCCYVQQQFCICSCYCCFLVLGVVYFMWCADLFFSLVCLVELKLMFLLCAYKGLHELRVPIVLCHEEPYNRGVFGFEVQGVRRVG